MFFLGRKMSLDFFVYTKTNKTKTIFQKLVFMQPCKVTDSQS